MWCVFLLLCLFNGIPDWTVIKFPLSISAGGYIWTNGHTSYQNSDLNSRQGKIFQITRVARAASYNNEALPPTEMLKLHLKDHCVESWTRWSPLRILGVPGFYESMAISTWPVTSFCMLMNGNIFTQARPICHAYGERANSFHVKLHE